MTNATIFVQIASYRDPECQWTIKDLFDKARQPDRVHVGVCWQYDRKQDHDCFKVASPKPDNTILLMIPASRSRGVCWARWNAQKLYDNEDYVLMVDSHMRFVEGWDEALIDELARCRSAKSILTHYPPGYKPPNELAPNPRPNFLRAKPFDDKGVLRFRSGELGVDPDRPLRGAFFAAGFVFAQGRLVREVPYDPFLYFDNEEACMAARVYTHGWDVYSPTRTFAYHYYFDANDSSKKTLHWSDHEDWTRLAKLSAQRSRYLLARREPDDMLALREFEKYGLGKERSLAQYQSFSGINFADCIASERALHGSFIENLDEYDPYIAELDPRHGAAVELVSEPTGSAPPARKKGRKTAKA